MREKFLLTHILQFGRQIIKKGVRFSQNLPNLTNLPKFTDLSLQTGSVRMSATDLPHFTILKQNLKQVDLIFDASSLCIITQTK